MKKTVWLFAALLVAVAAGMLYGQGPAAQEPQFVMIQWTNNLGSCYVYKGQGTEFETVKCKGQNPQNCFLELLAQYKSNGYRLFSTTASATYTGQVVVLEKQ